MGRIFIFAKGGTMLEDDDKIVCLKCSEEFSADSPEKISLSRGAGAGIFFFCSERCQDAYYEELDFDYDPITESPI